MVHDQNHKKCLNWAQQNLGGMFKDLIWTDETSVQMESHLRFHCYEKVLKHGTNLNKDILSKCTYGPELAGGEPQRFALLMGLWMLQCTVCVIKKVTLTSRTSRTWSRTHVMRMIFMYSGHDQTDNVSVCTCMCAKCVCVCARIVSTYMYTCMCAL